MAKLKEKLNNFSFSFGRSKDYQEMNDPQEEKPTIANTAEAIADHLANPQYKVNLSSAQEEFLRDEKTRAAVVQHIHEEILRGNPDQRVRETLTARDIHQDVNNIAKGELIAPPKKQGIQTSEPIAFSNQMLTASSGLYTQRETDRAQAAATQQSEGRY